MDATEPDGLVCFLPGPVALAPRVRAAFARPVVYHRSDEFLGLFERVRAKLSRLVGGTPAGLMVGSGTAANDAVAATIAASPAADNGLVLVSGEFGGRLLKQARRWGLRPRVLAWDWGRAWELDAVEDVFRTSPAGGWVWGVHHETSAGVRNDLPGLVRLAGRYGWRACVDCVSSLGTMPVDLSGVWLATGASGKALGSVAGLAVVFADPERLADVDAERVPAYLDVAATLATAGPRFTVPSPLAAALDAALDAFIDPDARFREVAELGAHVRRRLRAWGVEPLAADDVANPAIVTFAPPGDEPTAAFVERCRAAGYLVAGSSGYLADRRLAQIAVMGAVTRADIDGLFDRLASRTP